MAGKKNLAKLTKKIIATKTGKRTTVWVKTGEDPKKSPSKKKEEVKGEPVKKEHSIGNDLFEKIKREGKGKGGEVSLTSDEVGTLLGKGTVGFISAGKNPEDEQDMEMDDKAVAARDKELKAELVEKGYKFLKVEGKYGEVEESFMVMIPEIDRKSLVEMGSKYNQDSVVFSEKDSNELIFTTGEKQGKHYKGKGYEDLGEETKDFYTSVSTSDGQVKFSFNFDFEKLVKSFVDIVKKVKDVLIPETTQ